MSLSQHPDAAWIHATPHRLVHLHNGPEQGDGETCLLTRPEIRAAGGGPGGDGAASPPTPLRGVAFTDSQRR